MPPFAPRPLRDRNRTVKTDSKAYKIQIFGLSVNDLTQLIIKKSGRLSVVRWRGLANACLDVCEFSRRSVRVARADFATASGPRRERFCAFWYVCACFRMFVSVVWGPYKACLECLCVF